MAVDKSNPRAPVTWALIWALWLMATVTVALRFQARRMRRLSWGSDDYMVLVALFFTSNVVISATISVQFGIGKHVQDVSKENLERWRRVLFYGNIVYVGTSPSSKIAALLLYKRIFAIPKFRLIVSILSAFCIIWYIGELILAIWNCTPINGFWDKSIKSKCISTRVFDLQYAIINIGLDAIILALPVKMVLGLQLSKPQKIGLALLFLMGGLAMVAAIIRMVVFIRKLDRSDDYTFVWFEGTMWSCFEPSITIISVCLPVLRPIFLALVPAHIRSSFRSKANQLVFNKPMAQNAGRAATLVSARLKGRQADAAMPYRPFMRMDSQDERALGMIREPEQAVIRQDRESEARACGEEMEERTESGKRLEEEVVGGCGLPKKTDLELGLERQR